MTEVEDIVEEMGNRFAVRVSDRTRENLIRAYGRGADLVAYEATGKTGPVSLGGSTPSRVDAVIKEVCKPIEDWNRQLASDVSDAVRQKMAEGASPGELARFIREDLAEKIGDRPVTIHRDGKRPWTSTPKNYADLVSRTLPNRLRNEAYLEHGEKMGIYDGWVSIATGDERMCSICGARHGRFFPFGADVPPYHPRCRCRAVLHLREGATPPEGAPSPEELAWCKVAWEEIDDAYAKVVALDEERKRLAIRARGEPLAGADAKKLAQIEAQMARLRSKAAKKQAELYRVRAKFHAQMSWQQAEDRLRVGAGRDFAHFEGLKNSAARDVGAVLNAYMTDYPEFFADQMGLVLTHTEIGRGAVDRTLQREMVDELVRRGASRDWAQFVVGRQAEGQASELVKSLGIPPEGMPWATRRGDLGGLRVLVLHDQTVGDLDGLSAAMLQDVLAGRRSWGSENPLSVIESEMGRTIASKLDLAVKGSTLSDLYDSIGPARIREELSSQAIVSRQDFMAEAWVEFRLSPSPRPLATAVGRYMEEELQVYERQHRGRDRPAGSLGARLLDPATPVHGELPTGPTEAEIDAKVEESKRLRQRWADLTATIKSMNVHIKYLASRPAIPRAEIGSAEARYAIAREAEAELTQTHRAILDIDAWFRSSGVSPVPIAPWAGSRIELDPMPDLRGEALRKARELEKEIEQGIAQLRTWATEIEDFNSNVVAEIESGMGEDEMRSWLATVISTHKEMRALHKKLEPLVSPVKEWLDRDLGPALGDAHPDKTKIAHTLGSLLELIQGRLAGEAAEKLREAGAPHPGGVHETAEMVDVRARLLETEAKLARLRAEGSVGTIPERNQLVKEVVDMRREYGELMKADVLARSKVPPGRAVKESDKHLRTYLADTCGHKVRVDYGAVAKDSANLLNAMVAEYMDYAPTSKKGFSSIGDAAKSGVGDYSSAYAFTRGKFFGTTDRVGLYLNGSPKYFGNSSKLITSLRRDVQVGFHPPGTDTEKGVIDHEMAHVLDYWYGLGNTRKIDAIWSRLGPVEVKSGLSEYALKNKAEFIAEAWSEYKNSPNPRPISVEVGQAIEERIESTLKRKGRSLPGRVESPKPTVPPQMKDRLKSLRSKFGGLRLYILAWNETASKLRAEGLVRSQVETYVQQQETALKNAVAAAQVADEIRQIEEMYRTAGEKVPGKGIDSTVPPATRLDFDELVEKRAKLSKKRFADLLSQMRAEIKIVEDFNSTIESKITAEADVSKLLSDLGDADRALTVAIDLDSQLRAVAEEIEWVTGEDYVSKISPNPREIEIVVTEAEIREGVAEANAAGVHTPVEPPHPAGIIETPEMKQIRSDLLKLKAELTGNEPMGEEDRLVAEYGRLLQESYLARSPAPKIEDLNWDSETLNQEIEALVEQNGGRMRSRIRYATTAENADLINAVVVDYSAYTPVGASYGGLGTPTRTLPPGSAWAWVEPSQDRSPNLYVNPHYFGSLERLESELLRGVETGAHPKGCGTPKSILDHEMAHVLNDWFDLPNDPEIKAIWESKSKDQVSAELSTYANTNIHEFIAEAWSEYKNSPTPRPLSVQVSKLMERKIEGQLEKDGRSMPGRTVQTPSVPPGLANDLASARDRFKKLVAAVQKWNQVAERIKSAGVSRSEVPSYQQQQDAAFKSWAEAESESNRVQGIQDQFVAAGLRPPGTPVELYVPTPIKLDFDELVEKQGGSSKKRFADLLSQMRTHLRVVASFNESIESQITADADFYLLVARRAIAAGALQTAIEVASELLAVAEEIERATGEDYVSKISPNPREIELVVTEAEIQSKIEAAKKRAEGEANPPEPVPGGPKPYKDPKSKMYSWGGFERNVTVEERKVIDRYCSNDFEEINPLLRESRNFVREGDPDLVEKIRVLDNVVSRGRLKPQTVYRGMVGYPEVIQKFAKGVGTVVTDKAFVSTTADLAVAKGFAADSMGLPSILLEIQVPKGAPGVFVAPFSEAVTETGANENEILLPRNSRFKILSATRSSDGSYRVAAEMIVEG